MKQHKSVLTNFLPHRGMAFAPVADDDDELIKAIQSDQEELEDKWQLNELPDAEALEKFWDQAVQDLRKEKAKATSTD